MQLKTDNPDLFLLMSTEIALQDFKRSVIGTERLLNIIKSQHLHTTVLNMILIRNAF